MSDAESLPVCDGCDEGIEEGNLEDAKCCNKQLCKSCAEFADSCETCSAPLCDLCSELDCQTCQETNNWSFVCSKCLKECVFCHRDYCPEHLSMQLYQMEPCRECQKQPCLDKKHPKETFNFVLSCTECAVEQTKEARKRKRFFATPIVKKAKQQEKTIEKTETVE